MYPSATMRIVIDSDTGEILTALESGDRIVRANSVKHMNDTMKIPREERFTKMYIESVNILNNSKLSAADYHILLYLASHLKFQSNVAKYDNGRLITRASLTNDIKLSEETIKRSIRFLIKEGILCEIDSKVGKVFVMNPFIFNVGDVISKTVYDMFKATKWVAGRWGNG